MEVIRVAASDEALLDLDAAAWAGAVATDLPMVPAPLGMVAEVSPFLALSTDHGAITRLAAAAIHNGRMFALRLRWASDKHATLPDLDAFVDGVAVMFPMTANAIAMTMGAKGQAVNAWYWKANLPDPYEVVAEGFRSVRRLKDLGSDLRAAARHGDGAWSVVFRRSLPGARGLARLHAGDVQKVAFAAWDGGNAERSGRKSISGEFVELRIAP